MKKVLSVMLSVLMIISVLPLGSLSVLANTFDTAEEISVGDTITREIAAQNPQDYMADEYYYFKFTAQKAGAYKLSCSSTNTSGNATIYDKNRSRIDRLYINSNSSAQYSIDMLEGETYYIYFYMSRSSTIATYTVSLSAVYYEGIYEDTINDVNLSMNFDTGDLTIKCYTGNYYRFQKSSIPWANLIKNIYVEGYSLRLYFAVEMPNLESIYNEANGGFLDFYNYSSASKVYISSNTRIYGLKSVNDLYLGKTINSEYAFENIKYLNPNNIFLTDDCTSLIIENEMLLSSDRSCLIWAFSDEKTVEIPSEVDTIMHHIGWKSSAFDGLKKVEEYKVAKGNLSFKAVKGVLFDSYLHELVKYPRCAKEKHYNIPETVKSLANGAFCNIKYLEELYLPSSINTSFHYSFNKNSNFIMLVNIGSYAHYITVTSHYPNNNYNIETVINDVPSISENEELISNYAIKDKGRIVRQFTPNKTAEYELRITREDNKYYRRYELVVYDNQSNRIDSFSSYGNDDVFKKELEEGKTYYFSIGSQYYNNYNIGSLKISINEKNEESVFEVYKNGLYYYIDKNINTASVIGPSSDRYRYDILPKTDGCLVTSIEDYAFKGCSDTVCEINIPATVHSIGNGAFADCNELQYVNIDPDSEYLKYKDGVLFNADMTELIWYPHYLDSSSYTIPSTVHVINGGAFYGNKYLKNVTIPSSVVVIGEEAFSNTKLNEIEIPSSVRYIENDAFFNSSIHKLTLNEGLEEIEDGAFSSTLLKEVDIPSSVNEIKDGAFSACEYLTKATIRNPQMRFGEDVFRYDVEITGYEDSTAEAYAESNYMAFIDVELVGGENQSCEHSWVEVSRTPATCIASGRVVYECSTCGARKAELSPIREHSFASEKHDATPNAQGYTKYTCPVCGYAYVGDITPYASDASALEAAITEAHYYSKSKFSASQIQSIIDEAESYRELSETNAPQAEYDYAIGEILTSIESVDEYAKYEPVEINKDIVSIVNANGDEAELSFEENINEYSAPLDVVKDGIINAKDFAYLIKNYS